MASPMKPRPHPFPFARLGYASIAELKLPRIPDRRPVKFTIVILPDLNDTRRDYGVIYVKAYGHEKPLGKLIPGIPAALLDHARAGEAPCRDGK